MNSLVFDEESAAFTENQVATKKVKKKKLEKHVLVFYL